MDGHALKEISSRETAFEEHRVLLESPAGVETRYRVFVLYGQDGEPWMFAVQAAEWIDVHTAGVVRLAVDDVPADWMDDPCDVPILMALAALRRSRRDHREQGR